MSGGVCVSVCTRVHVWCEHIGPCMCTHECVDARVHVHMCGSNTCVHEPESVHVCDAGKGGKPCRPRLLRWPRASGSLRGVGVQAWLFSARTAAKPLCRGGGRGWGLQARSGLSGGIPPTPLG